MLFFNDQKSDKLVPTQSQSPCVQSHPVRVCKVPQRPGLHLAAPSSKTSQPVSLLAVQPLHVDLWQTGCTAEHSKQQVRTDMAFIIMLAILTWQSVVAQCDHALSAERRLPCCLKFSILPVSCKPLHLQERTAETLLGVVSSQMSLRNGVILPHSKLHISQAGTSRDFGSVKKLHPCVAASFSSTNSNENPSCLGAETKGRSRISCQPDSPAYSPSKDQEDWHRPHHLWSSITKWCPAGLLRQSRPTCVPASIRGHRSNRYRC